MVKETLKLESKVDRLGISVLMLLPDETAEVKGILQFVHGMSEYKERYTPVMEYFAKRGFVTVIHDHRGHGKSVRSMKDLGYMYEAGAKGMIEDILLVNEYIKEKYPERPLVMVGHSMGSLAARTFIREYDSCIDALVLSGAPSRNGAIDVAIALANVQKKLFGSRHPGNLLNVLAFSSYTSKFAKEKSKFAWVCADTAVVEAYDKDPLCGYTFTVDGFKGLFELLKQTYTKSGWRCSKPDLPVLFIGGEEDPCIGGAKKFKDEMDFLKNVGYKNVKGMLYPGMRHEVFNEKERGKVFRDVEMFLRENIENCFEI